jgi:DNA modification methylase
MPKEVIRPNGETESLEKPLFETSEVATKHMRHFFYFKEKKTIVPSDNPAKNELAQNKLQRIYENRSKYKIPERFIQSWDKVGLYSPNGHVEKADSLVLNPKDGAYHLGNKLNDLTGKEWVKFSCSWFIFNALREDLRAEKELDPKLEEHPATFSPTMISDFITFFTKTGATVLDPFCGIGSTLEACKRTNRKGFGIELNPKYYKLCLKRTPEFKDNIFNINASDISQLTLPPIDFCISSPPYWNILNRSTRTFHKDRKEKSLDINYSDHDADLGNIEDYQRFITTLSEIYLQIYEKLAINAYIVIIVKNIKKQGKMYPLAWDLAKILSGKYILKDEKVWIQDKISLAPYGYPFSWASNILHHYCLILRKENE